MFLSPVIAALVASIHMSLTLVPPGGPQSLTEATSAAYATREAPEAIPRPPGAPYGPPAPSSPASPRSIYDPSGILTSAEVGRLWLEARGPAGAEAASERVATCESGRNTRAHNPSGATGLWQIEGQVTDFRRSLYDAYGNAENAVAKFRASGNTWRQWTCQP